MKKSIIFLLTLFALFCGAAMADAVTISSPHASPPIAAAQQSAVVSNEGVPAVVTLPTAQQQLAQRPPLAESSSLDQSILSFFDILFKLLLIIALVLAAYFLVAKYVAKRQLLPSLGGSGKGLFDDYPDSERDREEYLSPDEELPFSPIKFFHDAHLTYFSKNEKEAHDMFGPGMLDNVLQNMKEEDGSSEYDVTVSCTLVEKTPETISIRYTGHDHDTDSEIDEVWHFVKKSGQPGKWCVNDITQVS